MREERLCLGAARSPAATGGLWHPCSIDLDEALGTFLAHNRAVEIDASYGAYDDHPLDRPDEWGDLASFRGRATGS